MSECEHKPYAVEADGHDADGNPVARTVWRCQRCGCAITGPVAEEATRRLAEARAARRLTWAEGDVRMVNTPNPAAPGNDEEGSA